MKTLYFSILFFSLVSPVFVHAESCPLSGDVPPCGVISLAEVIGLINQWAAGNASLSDVIGLINAWSAPQESVSKPVVELFVMSYCPFGLQMEKGLIPVLDTLNDSVNFSVKFCGYSMHGRIEINEQLIQYCIQREHIDRYIPYLRCFLADGNTLGCLNLTGINPSELAGCTQSADIEYNITQSYNNQSTWFAGRFPPFGIYKEETERYNIYSSPTLLVNGTIVETNRTPKSLLETICAGFATRPASCDANLSDAIPSPGFGFVDARNNQTGSC